MQIFKLISSIVSLYSLICFFRIILTWIPNYNYSKVSSVLSKICDPYLRLFSGISWLKFGSFDFSPALALCILGAASSVFSMLAHGGRMSLGLLLAMAIGMAGSIVSSLITFLILLFAIRLILLFINKNTYNTSGFILNQIDSSISPFVYKIARIFAGGRPFTYKTALIISIVVLIVVMVVFEILVSLLVGIIS